MGCSSKEECLYMEHKVGKGYSRTLVKGISSLGGMLGKNMELVDKIRVDISLSCFSLPH